jgi:pyruvate/2-oxoacid:ferredoxin oxidoreductase alpha subunit
MLVLDAFILSHTAEPVDIPEQKLADDFLPPYRPDLRLNAKDPHIFGCLAPPEYLMEFRYKIQQAMLQSKEICRKVDEEFGEKFGRQYGLVEPYRCEGADLILVTAGSVTSTARVAVDALREKGRKVGLAKLRLFRPFPKEELWEIVRGADKVAVLDRNLSAGIGGIFAHEIRAAFCNEKDRPPIYSYITGLGGRDTTLQTLNDVIYQTYERSRPEEQSAWVGLRT